MKQANNSFVFSSNIEKWQETTCVKKLKSHTPKDENGFTVRRTKGRAANL